MNQLDQYLAAAAAFVKKHAFWAELSAYLILAVGLAGWVGRDAYRQAAALSEQGQILERVRRGADTWLSTLQPASSAETQGWMNVQTGLQQLGSSADSRLTLLEVITRRAERAGLKNVRASLAAPDSLTPIPREGAPPVTIKVADYGIIVDFRGDFAATRTFLATLPPTVAVQRINISRTGAALGTRAVLTVYEAEVNAPN